MQQAPEAKAAVLTGAERRQHPRHVCGYQALCRSGGRAWWPVVFVNLSTGGAAVALSSPIELGATVAFTIYLPECDALQVRGRVLRVETSSSEWIAGCQFDRLLSDEELAQLL